MAERGILKTVGQRVAGQPSLQASLDRDTLVATLSCLGVSFPWHLGAEEGTLRTPTAADPLELVCDEQRLRGHVLEERSDVCV